VNYNSSSVNDFDEFIGRLDLFSLPQRVFLVACMAYANSVISDMGIPNMKAVQARKHEREAFSSSPSHRSNPDQPAKRISLAGLPKTMNSRDGRMLPHILAALNMLI
jgi:hypothetical protein